MSEKQLEKLYYSIYPMNQCETQSKSYEETKELCETLEKEMISLMSPDLQAMFEDYKEYTLNLKQTEQRDAYIDGLSETCNRIYKLQDVDVLFQCLLMDQMDWEEEKLYVQFSTIYLLKQTVEN